MVHPFLQLLENQLGKTVVHRLLPRLPVPAIIAIPLPLAHGRLVRALLAFTTELMQMIFLLGPPPRFLAGV